MTRGARKSRRGRDSFCFHSLSLSPFRNEQKTRIWATRNVRLFKHRLLTLSLLGKHLQTMPYASVERIKLTTSSPRKREIEPPEFVHRYQGWWGKGRHDNCFRLTSLVRECRRLEKARFRILRLISQPLHLGPSLVGMLCNFSTRF